MQSFQGIFETCAIFISLFKLRGCNFKSDFNLYFLQKRTSSQKKLQKEFVSRMRISRFVISRDYFSGIITGTISRENSRDLLFTKSADLLFNQRFILIEKISSQSETIYSEAYSGPCQTSKMELFFLAVNYFQKKLHLRCLTKF